MEKLHSLIDDLELMVDKLPKEANWFGNVDHIRQTIKDMRRALQQAPCSTLRELLVQMLNKEREAIIKNEDLDVMNKHFFNLQAIRDVIQLIDDQKPVA